MSIVAFKPDDSKAWNQLVESFEEHDVYYLCEYVKAFQLHGDGVPLLIYFESPDNMRAINVVMKRDIAEVSPFNQIGKGKLFDFVTPYGYGGWIVSNSTTEGMLALKAEYESWCQNQGVVTEFVRFHPVLQNQKGLEGLYEIVSLGLTVCMDISSREAIWANLTSKNRNMIRKAQKSGVVIGHGNSAELYEQFVVLYNATMSRDNASDYYYFDDTFYTQIREGLGGHAELFYAVTEDGAIVSSSIMIQSGNKMNYHLSGSDVRYRNLASSNYLLFEAALWGCENGYKTLLLGGGVGSKEDSLFAFKKAFMRNAENYQRFFIGKKVFLLDEYSNLLSLAKASRSFDCSDQAFFPEYRACS